MRVATFATAEGYRNDLSAFRVITEAVRIRHADEFVFHQRVGDLELPAGSLLISVLREGTGFVPGPDTVLQPGDEVLAVLDPGLEDDLKAYFGPDGGSGE